ncbi:Wzz/FepE/Etk N-terminal domain-containing protein [Pedomonas sp. V897]|uniref:Wzz/FepE/Etk N-terminal domain-containing protein n=1 Tax=Pedomonas sp. V897 TaxID=3446482 RepID=UPI003EE355AB
MTPDTPISSIPADAVVGNVWRQKWIVIAASLCGLLLAVIYNHTATPRYTVEARLAPVSQNQFDGRMASIGLDFPNLGGLIGGGNTEFNQLVSRLTSFDVAARVMQDRALVARLAASKTAFRSVLDSRKEWVEPAPSMSRKVMVGIQKLLGQKRGWTPPSPAQLANYLDKNLKVTTDRDSGLATLEIVHPDPKLGEDLLNAVMQAALAVTREQRQIVIGQQLDYVRQQLETEAISEVRKGLTANLERLLASEIDIRSKAPVVGQVFQAARATEHPTHPKPILNAALGLILGALISSALIVAHDLVRLRATH